jgi:hypothetical protein
MPSKLCSTCSVEKPVSEFYKQTTRGTYGVRGSCKACDNLKKQSYRAKLGETLKLRKKQEYSKNRESRLAQKKEYRQSNRGKINALVAARKKVIKQRTPKWVTKEELWLIKEAYELAALRTKMFNFSWHVDHVLPLQGETVSGLHVPNNLQVIPGKENVRKGNRMINHAN